ncbi:MAG: hypothetical protein N2379_09325 [Verrucomicrobiae bacterium]|nr:hypothetical protein [Verrucomicrobiae bacterium]
MNLCPTNLPSGNDGGVSGLPVRHQSGLSVPAKRRWSDPNFNVPGMYLMRLRHHIAARRKRWVRAEPGFTAR